MPTAGNLKHEEMIKLGKTYIIMVSYTTVLFLERSFIQWQVNEAVYLITHFFMSENMATV